MLSERWLHHHNLSTYPATFAFSPNESRELNVSARGEDEGRIIEFSWITAGFFIEEKLENDLPLLHRAFGILADISRYTSFGYLFVALEEKCDVRLKC